MISPVHRCGKSKKVHEFNFMKSVKDVDKATVVVGRFVDKRRHPDQQQTGHSLYTDPASTCPLDRPGILTQSSREPLRDEPR
jgi:hypothetical protein